MSRSGLTRTKFPANDKLLPTSHATAATPKTSQFLLIGNLLCKAMIVSHAACDSWCRWAYRFSRQQDGSKRGPTSSLFDEHRFHFSQARALHPPNKSDVENH